MGTETTESASGSHERPLDVLVVESHREWAEDQVAELAAAGHRVRRCHEQDEEFPCTEISEPGSCPLHGGVDVVLLVRRSVTPRPTGREQGVSCALRAGVPVVEDGPESLDPYAAHVSARVAGRVVGACEQAAADHRDELAAAVVRAVGPLAGVVGVPIDAIGCTVERDGHGLHVRLSGPFVAPSAAQRLAVRARDTLRDLAPGRAVDVDYVSTQG